MGMGTDHWGYFHSNNGFVYWLAAMCHFQLGHIEEMRVCVCVCEDAAFFCFVFFLLPRGQCKFHFLLWMKNRYFCQHHGSAMILLLNSHTRATYAVCLTINRGDNSSTAPELRQRGKCRDFDDSQEMKGKISLKTKIEQKGILLILRFCTTVITMHIGRRGKRRIMEGGGAREGLCFLPS